MTSACSVYRGLADYLSSINLSSSAQWNYRLETLPRPTGRATRVVITEYDLPREVIEPHDVIVDEEGIAWYSSFGEQNLGRLDPKTGEVTEFPIPLHKPGFPTGLLGLRSDREGNLWLGNMYQGTIIKFDRKTKTFRFWPLPPEQNIDAAQVNMVSPQSSHVDGKVWCRTTALLVCTGWTSRQARSRPGSRSRMHPRVNRTISMTSSRISKNNLYFTDFRQQHIGRIDAKTGEIKLLTIPTPGSAPRRGMMDTQDRLWFGEFRGDRIGMLDTRTGQFKEWAVPIPWSNPYDVTIDKNEDAWAGSMSNDRILRLNTKTGEFTSYLLPRSTNIRRVFVDNASNPVTFWVGNNHGASIIKLEPID